MENEKITPVVDSEIVQPLKSKLLIVLAIVFFIALILGIFLGKTFFSEKQQFTSPKMQSQIVSSLEDATPSLGLGKQASSSGAIKEKETQSFASPDSTYSFNFYPKTDNWNKCLFYTLKNSNGEKIDINDLMGIKEIPCDNGMFGYSTDVYKGWGINNKLITEVKKGEIKIIDVVNHMSEKLNYDGEVLKLDRADESLKFWLFTKDNLERGTVQYVLQDEKNNKLGNYDYSTNSSSGYGIFGSFYDSVNDGFLFVNRYYKNGNQISIKFDFLSLPDVNMRNILTTEFVPFLGGRGCMPTTLASKEKGEIILSGDCLIMDSKYKDKEGFIHIQLK